MTTQRPSIGNGGDCPHTTAKADSLALIALGVHGRVKWRKYHLIDGVEILALEEHEFLEKLKLARDIGKPSAQQRRHSPLVKMS